LRFPNSLSPEAFLAACWQKQALFMPGALDGIHPSLSSGDLAWLATQADVESRLVMTQSDGKNNHYEVRHGPFEKDVLSSLPRRNWTLLVQDVEKHLPDFRALLTIAGFIPDWRIDDLMVSFAAPGGSVGPHMDNYDVFLCQGEGRREWHLGDKDDANPDPFSGELSLLKPFADPKPQTATDGDILYLPPGVPHWGIATDFCMTYSIGMRAPTLAELNATAARLFDEAENVTVKSSASGADVFYEDPDLAADEAEPGLISDAAIHRAKKILASSRQLDDVQTAMTLGATVTDPKAWLAPECVSDDDAASIIATLDQNRTLGVHGMARIAFCQSGESKLLFANGFLREVDSDSLGVFRDICKNRSVRGGILCADHPSGLSHWLLTSGVFDLTEPAA
jgi:50S ribosomal protein L16 3-hydroxylase